MTSAALAVSARGAAEALARWAASSGTRGAMTHVGHCHCGAIRFEIRTEITDVARCNCSLDIRRNAFIHYVDPGDFTLISGEEVLATYQFGSCDSKHHFCKICGVFPFFWSNYDGREHYGVNVGCLEGVDPYAYHLRLVDGKSF